MTDAAVTDALTNTVADTVAGTVRGAFAVPADHPCLPGHFPGRPVVPGVVLLDLAFAAAREAGLPAPARIASAKFTRPVLPGEPVALAFRRTPGGRVAFSGSCGAERAFAGEYETGGHETGAPEAATPEAAAPEAGAPKARAPTAGACEG